MKILLLSLSAALFFCSTALPQGEKESRRSGCVSPGCHEGIADIRGAASPMMRRILEAGRKMGDPGGCIVCHGGNPAAESAEGGHSGTPAALTQGGGPDGFYPDPGSPWINDRTCGVCHPKLVAAQWNSLMMTEAGKIQGTSWSFGSLQGYNHGWGNYDARNPADPHSRRGTDAYRSYMAVLKSREPQVYPEKMTQVPNAPEDLSALAEHPEQAAFTYMRAECQRCHLGVRGRERRGDYRGMGCSACHIPYGNEGIYEGKDRSIPADGPRHLLVHTIQSSRNTEVTIHGTTYTGIPVETCTTCHDRGKRIGVAFQGLMESAYTSPFTEGGGGQADLHSKHYMAMKEDIHYQKGMICQDCHTTIDVHGDGFLAGTNLAHVEIECADCHGTPEAFPWELPLGFGDEFRMEPASGPPRGTLREPGPDAGVRLSLPDHDGHLLTARGNAYPEVVRRGDLVVLHGAGGKDFELKPLKLLVTEGTLETEPAVAMKEIGLHIETMECYACHATWAPQCYGCHVKIDYSGGKRSLDWVAAGSRHARPDGKADAGEGGYDCMLAGEVSEQRSYMRFENPPLGVNGEGRITPIIPGCQPSITVIGADGETVYKNKIFRSQPNCEGAGTEGQLCIDMSPANPHTSGRARSCESCHLSEKALGHGINGGRFSRGWDEAVVIDLMTADRQVLPRSARPQIEAVEGLVADWSRFVAEDGSQLQTVGHHFSLSGPLSDASRAHIDRRGVCLSCHREIPKGSLAVSLLHHVAAATGRLPETGEEHDGLVGKILFIAAWGQVGGAFVGGMVFLSAIVWWLRRRRLRAKENHS
jgi:hypothetical protein